MRTDEELVQKYAELRENSNMYEAIPKFAEWVIAEREAVLEEYKKVTGFANPGEYYAYEKGEYAMQDTIKEFIKKWDGSTNSVMGQVLHDKFKELDDNLKHNLHQ